MLIEAGATDGRGEKVTDLINIRNVKLTKLGP